MRQTALARATVTPGGTKNRTAPSKTAPSQAPTTNATFEGLWD